MLRRASVIVAVLCLLSSGVGVASATTLYTLTDLGNPGSYSSASAVATMNNQPLVVGSGQVTSTSVVNACYWTPNGSGGFALTDLDPRSKAPWVLPLMPGMSGLALRVPA